MVSTRSNLNVALSVFLPEFNLHWSDGRHYEEVVQYNESVRLRTRKKLSHCCRNYELLHHHEQLVHHILAYIFLFLYQATIPMNLFHLNST
jgi:hypothetical protein